MAWTGHDATKVVSVYSSGYGVGPNLGLNREDLLDVITNVDPWDNIVFAMLPKRRARSTTHEWPVDVIPTVSRSGVADGSDFDEQAITKPLRFKNYTQIFRWDTKTTGTEEAVDTAGMGEKLAYQVLNATHAMAKAVEQRILDIGSNIAGLAPLDLGANFTSSAGLGTSGVPGFGGVAGVGASNAGRLMAPLFQLIPNAMIAAYPNWTSPVVDGGNVALAASKVDDACQILFNNGLSPETLVLSPGVKRNLATDIYANTGTTNTRFLQAEGRKYIRGVDVYEGELCTLSIIPNRSVAGTTSGTGGGFGTAWVLQKDKLGIAFLRPIKAVPIAQIGDSQRKMIIGEMTLELLHPVAAAPITKVLG